MTDSSDMQGLAGIVLAGAPRSGSADDDGALVRQAASAAVDAGLWPVVVVLALSSDPLRGALAGLPVVTVCGAGAGPGAPALLQRGLARLLECAPAAGGVMLLGSEEAAPLPGHLAALAAAARQQGRPLAATAAGGAVREPALFGAAVFPELRALAPDQGPEVILARDPGRVALVAPQDAPPAAAPVRRLRGVR
ncbi:MAG: NTP transferase domain-containing protein [Anaeromyxobacter sp.]